MIVCVNEVSGGFFNVTSTWEAAHDVAFETLKGSLRFFCIMIISIPH